MEGEDFSRLYFRGVRLENCRFLDCHFERTSFLDVEFRSCDFSNCKLEGCYFGRCVWTGCEIAGLVVSDSHYELAGAIVTATQAAQLARLLGLEIREEW